MTATAVCVCERSGVGGGCTGKEERWKRQDYSWQMTDADKAALYRSGR